MFRTKLTLAGLAAIVAIGAQTAVAQAKANGPSNPPFITDTLAPGGGVTIYHRWFILEHARPASEPQGYRFITDTLAPGGGTSEVSAPAASGFDWADAGIGACVMAGLGLMLLGSARLLRRRRVLAV